MASLLQRYWADNQVSCTICFDKEKEGMHLENVLNEFQWKLKGISFLPRIAKGVYKQMVYEKITEQEYLNRLEKLRPIDFSKYVLDEKDKIKDEFCDSEQCTF